MKRAQIFSIDFVFSFVILIAMLILLNSYFQNLDESVSRQESSKRIFSASEAAIDFMVSSPGFPDDWAGLPFESVSNVGLKASGGGLDLQKLVAFSQMASDDYAVTAVKIGLSGFDFKLTVYENLSSEEIALSGVARQPVAYFASDQREFFDVIGNSTAVWDYYWGTGTLPQPDWGTSRSNYSGTKAELFNELLSNHSGYNSIVVEEPGLAPDDVNQTLLNEFFDQGGVMVFIAGNSDAQIFLHGTGSLFRKDASSVDGTVNHSGFFLDGAAQGNVTSVGRWVAYGIENSTLDSFVSSQPNSTESIAAAWNVSWGRAYFVSDLNSDFGGTAGKSVFNILGTPLEFGSLPDNSTFVVVENRFSYIRADKRIPVSVTLVVSSG